MRGALPEAILDRLSLKSEGSRPAKWTSFSEREWHRALTWLDLSGLGIYFLREMKRSRRLDVLPAAVRARLDLRQADNRRRTVEIVQELGELSSSFERAGVRYAILKGIALTPDYCPDPAFRTQYDHDVLLDPADLEAAHRVLRNAGYRRKDGGSQSVIVYRQPEPRIRFPENSVGLYSPRLDRSIEIHLTLWEAGEDKIGINLPDDFLDRARPRQWDEVGFVALCDEDCLLFQVLHAFRHILRNWCRLSVFLEIARFLDLKSPDAAFWNSFRERIDGIRWAPEASLLTFTLAETLFGARIPDPLRASLTTRLSPAVILWIDRYGRRSALSNFSRDKCSLFLHEEFVDSSAQWVAIRRRRLLPVQRPHRPPAVVFQRGFSSAGRFLMEGAHSLRRLQFHILAAVRYALEYPRWIRVRRVRLAGSSRSV